MQQYRFDCIWFDPAGAPTHDIPQRWTH